MGCRPEQVIAHAQPSPLLSCPWFHPFARSSPSGREGFATMISVGIFQPARLAKKKGALRTMHVLVRIRSIVISQPRGARGARGPCGPRNVTQRLQCTLPALRTRLPHTRLHGISRPQAVHPISPHLISSRRFVSLNSGNPHARPQFAKHGAAATPKGEFCPRAKAQLTA